MDVTREKVLRMVRNMIPKLSGNLRERATYAIDKGGGDFDIIVDTAKAPYAQYVGTKEHLFSNKIPSAITIMVGEQTQNSENHTSTASVKGIETLGEKTNMYLSRVGAENKNGGQFKK